MAEQEQQDEKKQMDNESTTLLEERLKLELSPPSPDGQPSIILGTMEFGRRLNEDQSVKVSELFIKEGYNQIDTAYVYQGGKSETYIGNMYENILSKSNILLQTKVNPNYKNKDNIKLGLSPQG
eukprot:807584_1